MFCTAMIAEAETVFEDEIAGGRVDINNGGVVLVRPPFPSGMGMQSKSRDRNVIEIAT